MGLREVLIPQDQVFFDLFEEMADILVTAADLLVRFMESGAHPPECSQEMKDLEHAGDTVTHRIYNHLNRTFITPLEPEEISHLASVLDDVLDCIEGSIQMMRVYGVDEADDVMRQLAKLIRLSTVEVQGATRGLRKLSNGKQIAERVIEINRIENLADDVLGHALSDLFKTNDPVRILKLKDVYSELERATDRCEMVANIISDIVIRHS
ncbi:MAG: DUF47 family protein [Methanospirillum sp.]|nr:DUF47 family protein [Methanospirillum sp.]